MQLGRGPPWPSLAVTLRRGDRSIGRACGPDHLHLRLACGRSGFRTGGQNEEANCDCLFGLGSCSRFLGYSSSDQRRDSGSGRQRQRRTGDKQRTSGEFASESWTGSVHRGNQCRWNHSGRSAHPTCPFDHANLNGNLSSRFHRAVQQRDGAIGFRPLGTGRYAYNRNQPSGRLHDR